MTAITGNNNFIRLQSPAQSQKQPPTLCQRICRFVKKIFSCIFPCLFKSDSRGAEYSLGSHSNARSVAPAAPKIPARVLPKPRITPSAPPKHKVLDPVIQVKTIEGLGKDGILAIMRENEHLLHLASARNKGDYDSAAYLMALNIGNKISYISQNVMVGSEVQAASWNLLEKERISLVVNVPGDYRKHASVHADHVSCNFFEGSMLRHNSQPVRYFEGGVPDDGLTPLPLTEIIRNIKQEIESGRRVLIHCKEGKSRTGAVAIAWIMFNEGMKFDQAYAEFRKRRGIPEDQLSFVPTPFLLNQLRKWNPGDVLMPAVSHGAS